MKNTTVLQLVEKLMYAHNSTCSETFLDIEFSIENETIQFDILTSEIGEAVKICELLNLTLHVETNVDQPSDKSLYFFIT